MPTEPYHFLNRSKPFDVRLYFILKFASNIDGSALITKEDLAAITNYVETLENLLNRAEYLFFTDTTAKDAEQWRQELTAALGSIDFAAQRDEKAGEDE